MSTFAQHYNLQLGDVVVVPKSQWKIVQHYLVYLGLNENWQEVYAENKVNVGVRLISGEQFAKENPSFFRIRRFNGNNFQRNLVVQRALSLVGSQYNVTSFNCEHYTNYAQYGNAYSKQVGNVFVAAIAFLLLGGLGGAAASK